ncbi:Electron transfer flavoprotein alpha-subunit, partial [Spiromyces aspiralis]
MIGLTRHLSAATTLAKCRATVATTTVRSSIQSSLRRSLASLFSTLVLAEHKNSQLAECTLNAISAAKALGSTSITTLVAGGETANEVALKAASVEGVSKVLLVKDKAYEHLLPEDTALLIKAIRDKVGATHVVAAHSAIGKNIMPRVAALLDVQQISDVIGIESQDTFVRPIYAGNAIATVKSTDPIKVLTIRTTSFPAAEIQNSASSQPEEAAPAEIS